MLRSRLRGRMPRKRQWARMALWRVPVAQHRSEGSLSKAKARIVGQAVLVTFAATRKSDPPSRAERMHQPTQTTHRTQQSNQQRITLPLPIQRKPSSPLKPPGAVDLRIAQGKGHPVRDLVVLTRR